MVQPNIKNILIVILGPTAGGKTSVAAHLADRINAEIISADSRQVYRKMDIGTGKDYNDYTVNGKKIPYHLINIKEPGYKYNVFEFQKDFFKVYSDITERNKVPVLCGGTGLYIEAATQGYQMTEVPPNVELRDMLELKTIDELADILRKYRPLHNTTDIDTKKRTIRAIEIEQYQAEHKPGLNKPEINPVFFGIRFDREIQRNRITERLIYRLKNGMIEEVENLLSSGLTAHDLEYYGLEYKYLTKYLTGEIDYDTMFTQLNTAIHQFAKRQMTWFRRMERKGIKINWVKGDENMDNKIRIITGIINKLKQ